MGYGDGEEENRITALEDANGHLGKFAALSAVHGHLIIAIDPQLEPNCVGAEITVWIN